MRGRRKRGECSGCHRPFPLCDDGTVQFHKGWHGECSGAHCPPSRRVGAAPDRAGAKALREAAADLLATDEHEDLCSYGPDGTCNCALGEHHRWLLARADDIAKGGDQ